MTTELDTKTSTATKREADQDSAEKRLADLLRLNDSPAFGNIR